MKKNYLHANGRRHLIESVESHRADADLYGGKWSVLWITVADESAIADCGVGSTVEIQADGGERYSLLVRERKGKRVCLLLDLDSVREPVGIV